MKFPATLRYCWLLARRYLCERLSICLSLKLKSTKFKHSECKTFERRFSKITRFNAKRYIITRRNKRETGSILPRVLAQGIDTIKLQSLGHRQTIRMYKGRKFRARLNPIVARRTIVDVPKSLFMVAITGLFKAGHRVACARLRCVRAHNAPPRPVLYGII